MKSKTDAHIDCPHCEKRIYLNIDKDFAGNLIEKELARKTQGLRDEITRLKSKIKTAE